MPNKRTAIISKRRHRNKYALVSYDSMNWNIRCKSWSFMRFLKFVAIWFIVLWSSLAETLYISINFKSRGISCSCGIYCMHIVLIIHVDNFRGSKGDFPEPCAATSFEIYICSFRDRFNSHWLVSNSFYVTKVWQITLSSVGDHKNLILHVRFYRNVFGF